MATVGIMTLCFLSGGCAAMAIKTEGTSGPIAWRVADLRVVGPDVPDRTDSVSFTLEIRNVSDRTVTFTQMERTVYRPGTGPGSTNHTGRWELRPGGEWKIPLSSRTVCRSYAGCSGSGATQVLWRIVLTGEDDQNRPIEARLDIVLPPQATGPTPPKK